ncbi:hypothetical protein MMC24_006281 [Lignoscripta atroalba]|nr:hypothetical protein [Lignoscripta atroalba]
MRTHNISTSVISLANPWLDFLDPQQAAKVARSVNDEMEAICAEEENQGRLYAFGTLPLSAPIAGIVAEVKRLGTLPHIKGIILGTTGLGSGLDDPALDPVWEALEESQFLVFVHPHYGLPAEVFGPRQEESGHVLPLSLGFPMETTLAFVRMFLAGVFERYGGLKVLLAHAGGTVPFLAGRVDSCVQHERKFRDEKGEMVGRRRQSVWEVLRKNVWLDGVIYSEVGLKAAVEAVGVERVLFGTDHPFFPPLEQGSEEWASVVMNVEAVRGAFGPDEDGAAKVLGGNAVRLLGLDVRAVEGGGGG